MSWLRKVLTFVDLVRPARNGEARAAARAERVIARADRVLDDYRRQDTALKLVVVKRR